MNGVSLIYVNYFTYDLIANSIKSFEKYHGNLNYEIIIVDNSCSKDEYLKLKSLNFQHLKIICSERNLGFGNANNLGAEYAKFEILFFINPDTVFVENSVEIMKNKIECNNYSILGCNLVTVDFQPNYSFSKNNTSLITLKKDNSLISIIKRRIKGPYYKNYNFDDRDIEVGFVCGAALMIKKSIFYEIGCFDKDIFMYSEEDELCFFARKMNHKVFNTSKTKIVHLEGGSFDVKYSDDRFLRFISGGYIYFLKCFNQSTAIKYLKILRKINRKKLLFTLDKNKKEEFIRKIRIIDKMLIDKE